MHTAVAVSSNSFETYDSVNHRCTTKSCSSSKLDQELRQK